MLYVRLKEQHKCPFGNFFEEFIVFRVEDGLQQSVKDKLRCHLTYPICSSHYHSFETGEEQFLLSF